MDVARGSVQVVHDTSTWKGRLKAAVSEKRSMSLFSTPKLPERETRGD